MCVPTGSVAPSGVFFGDDDSSVNGTLQRVPYEAVYGLPKTPQVLQWMKRSSRASTAQASRLRMPSTLTRRKRSSEAL